VADGLQAWQSSQDLPWVKSAGLLAFYDDLSTDVKAEWCGEFTRSLTILPEDEGFLTGTMDNVRVIWNGAYLYDFFRWTGEGVSAWIPACAVAKPVLVDWIGNACPEAYSLFDTHAIAQVKDPSTWDWGRHLLSAESQIHSQGPPADCNACGCKRPCELGHDLPQVAGGRTPPRCKKVDGANTDRTVLNKVHTALV
jgi:hypothetical protein